MNKKLFIGLIGALLLGAGCVKTLTDRTTGGVPFVKDTVTGHYERPVEQVFEASKNVIDHMGTLINESVLHSTTNMVRTVEGRVNQRKVYVRVEALDPKVTAVAVQARTMGGSADLDLAHEVEKEIALKLVH
jgi:hypothetical protein